MIAIMCIAWFNVRFPRRRAGARPAAGRELDRCGPVVSGVVPSGREPADVAAVAADIPAMTGPTPKRSVSDVPDATTASAIRCSIPSTVRRGG